MTESVRTMGRRGFLRWLALGALAVGVGIVPRLPDGGGTEGRVSPVVSLPKGAPKPDVESTAPTARPRPVTSEVVDEPVVLADEPTRHLEVICREATGLVPASDDSRGHAISLLTLHHTAVRLDDPRGVPGRLRGHQAFHRRQGWPDIAYHYGVDPLGNVYELRDPSVPGDTFTDYDPAGHLLIVCEGDYTVDQPTEAMLDAVSGVFAYASAHFGVSLETLGGHGDHASTRCPGQHLAGRMDEIRARAARRTAPVLTRLCGTDGVERIRSIEVG